MGFWAAKSAVLVAARLGLSDKAARCLVHMALESLDKSDKGSPPRRFYGGRDSLATALGYVGDEAGTPASHAAVKRAIAQLVDNGAIQVFREGRGGYRTEYYLRLRSERPESSEVLPALESTPAMSQGHARRTPVAKEANGLRTRTQQKDDPQERSQERGTPGVPLEVRPADAEGHAQRREGVRPALDRGTPGGPPKRSEQEEQDEQHSSRTRVRA